MYNMNLYANFFVYEKFAPEILKSYEKERKMASLLTGEFEN